MLLLFLKIRHSCSRSLFSALVLTCYCLKKDRAAFYRPETIVASLLLLMVLFFRVIFNYTSKRQFVVLYFRIIILIYYVLLSASCKIYHNYVIPYLMYHFLSKYVFLSFKFYLLIFVKNSERTDFNGIRKLEDIFLIC